MWNWLKLFRGRSEGSTLAAPPAYRIYTTEFDRIIHSDEIAEFVGGEAAFREYALELDRALTRWRAAAEISAIELTGKVLALKNRVPSVVSLLLDHSGSMRGQHALLAIAIVE